MKAHSWLLVAVLGLAACSTADDDVVDDEDVGQTESAQTAATCAPSRASGVLGRYDKALHDMIAFAEGTEQYGARDGYDTMFTFRKFGSCARHPNVRNCAGRLCSTAAGRYQFLTTTWNTVSRGIDARNFEPENQERGARYLITRVRRVNVPAGRPMTAAEFSNAMSKLSYEWASLPPSRYGQAKMSLSTARRNYCSNLGGC